MKSTRKGSWLGYALILLFIITLPINTILMEVFEASNDNWKHIKETVLQDYIINSLILILGVSFGSLLLGIPTAWLTAVCSFPFKRTIVLLLILPMAMPAYIIAYTYTGIFDFAGPVQSNIRKFMGWNYGDYFFPEVRSIGGAIIMFSLVLYPYVYLLARTSFLNQSANVIEISRLLNTGPWKSFLKVAFPLARPAILVGLSLVLMETLADYGTVSYFGVTVFTTGIFKTWFGLGDYSTAAKMAGILLIFIFALIVAERYSRKRNRYYNLIDSKTRFSEYISLIYNSVLLASVASIISLLIAFSINYCQRIIPTFIMNLIVRLISTGYALPGTIIAIGIITPLAFLDHKIDEFLGSYLSMSFGLIFSGSLFAIQFAYLVRFLSISVNTIESGLEKIRPNMDKASQILGITSERTFICIHLPILKVSILTSFLLVFVDVIKELPATLILRPFDFNTLAVKAYELASDERLIDASIPSVIIVFVGLLPFILINNSINNLQDSRRDL